MIFRCLIVFIFSFVHVSLSAQTSKEVFETYVDKFQKRNNFKVGIVYKTFKGESKVPFQIVKGEKRYTTLGYLETSELADNIIGKDFSIQVNKAQKSVFYTKKVINPKGSQNFDLSLLTNYFEVLPLDIVANGMLYKVVFQLKITLSDFPYSRIEFYINKKTYELQKQVFYSTTVADFSSASNKLDIAIQRLEIDYSNYTDFTIIENPEIYNKKNYIITASNTIDNQNVSLQQKYKGYQLITAPN